MRGWIALVAALAAAVAVAMPASAGNDTPGQKTSSSTTLDACGYFVGTQTAHKTTTDGVTTTEKGTWTGVDNNYGGGPVASLGDVKGSYTETVTRNADGSISGVETFKSDAGKISQTFAYDPATGWHVDVQATDALAFLTSSTDGACYSGAFPRP